MKRVPPAETQTVYL